MAGHWHGPPALVFAPHRGAALMFVSCDMTRPWSMRLLVKFSPPPPGSGPPAFIASTFSVRLRFVAKPTARLPREAYLGRTPGWQRARRMPLANLLRPSRTD